MKSNKIISRKRYNLIRFEGGVVQNFDQEKRKLRVLIAGGGIGGLVLALAAKHRGYEVKVFEKDLSAIRGEGRHRGPIQLMSSALSVLEAIDESVVKKIMEVGCVTGNRINGLADGVSGEWYVFHFLISNMNFIIMITFLGLGVSWCRVRHRHM